MANTRYQLPVIDTISACWNKVHGAKSGIWCAFGLYLLMVLGVGIVVGIVKMVSPMLSSIVNFVLQIYLNVLMFGLYYIGYLRAKDAPFNYKTLFRGVENPKRTLQVVLTLIIIWLVLLPPIVLGILTSIGAAMGGMDSTFMQLLVGIIYIVCFAAGIFLLIRTSLAVLFALDRDVKAWDAIKLSFHATKNNVFRMIGIYVLTMLIVAVSIIPLGIGLIWTIPLLYIVAGTIYKNLQNNIG